jgi:hypothetical protein
MKVFFYLMGIMLVFNLYSQVSCNQEAITEKISAALSPEMCIPEGYIVRAVFSNIDVNCDGFGDKYVERLILRMEIVLCSCFL